MAGNRKKATEFLLKYLEKIEKGTQNVELYKKTLSAMSDAEFEKMIVSIENDEFVFPIISPNFQGSKISTQNNIKVGKELGHSFFSKLRLTDPATGETYVTPLEYMVIDLPFRRQSQTIAKKLSVAENTKKIDDMTDQPTGSVSKTSTLSFPEIQVLHSLGLSDTMKELLKARGGDLKAMNRMNQVIMEGGEADLDELDLTGGKVKSTETLSILLKGMHLDNNL